MMDKKILHTEIVDGVKRYKIRQFSLIDELLREDLEDDPILLEYAATHGFGDIFEAYKDFNNMIFRRARTGSLL